MSSSAGQLIASDEQVDALCAWATVATEARAKLEKRRRRPTMLQRKRVELTEGEVGDRVGEADGP